MRRRQNSDREALKTRLEKGQKGCMLKVEEGRIGRVDQEATITAEVKAGVMIETDPSQDQSMELRPAGFVEMKTTGNVIVHKGSSTIKGALLALQT